MGRYLLKRFLNYAIMFFVAVTLAYFIAASRLNPRLLYDITNPNLDWDSINAALRDRNLNPDESILSRYWGWLGDVVRWDWGEKPKGGFVNEEIANRVFVSFRLIIVGFLVGTIGGILLGAWTATKQYKVSDRAVTLWSLLIISTPIFVLIVVLQILTVHLGRWFDFQFEFLGEFNPSARRESFIPRMLDRIEHLVLPTLALALPNIAIYSRYQRNLMLDTLHADYVRTARAKGLTRRRAVFKHALRTALIPVGTLFAFSAAAVFAGAIFTETLFGWHGMGEYLVTSLNGQDVHGAVAVSAFGAVTVFVGAMFSEVLVVVLDPRVRVS
jgi:peptide/nickel transport system permease protein